MTAFTDEHRAALREMAMREARGDEHRAALREMAMREARGVEVAAALAAIDRLRAWQEQARIVLANVETDVDCEHIVAAYGADPHGPRASWRTDPAAVMLLDPDAELYGMCAACASALDEKGEGPLWLVDQP